MSSMRISTCLLYSIGLSGCFDAPAVSETETEGSGTDAGTTNVDATAADGVDVADGMDDQPDGTDAPDDGTDDPGDGTMSDSGPSDSSGSDDSGVPVCGDGRVTGDEVCDDGVNDGSYDGCMEDCSAFGPFCGDSEMNGDEACDDGNDVHSDGCNPDCVVSGTELWSQTYDGTNALGDAAFGVAVDGDDTIVVAGEEGVSSADDMLWLRRYDADGGTVWTETYSPGAGFSAGARGVGVAGTGEIVVAGAAEDPGVAGFHILVQGYPSAGGNASWTRFINGETGGFSDGQDAAADATGNGYVAARIDAGTHADIYVRSYDSAGNVNWTQQVDPSGLNDFARGIAVQGDLVAVAASQEVTDGNTDVWVRLYDTDGNALWTRSFDGGTIDYVSAVAFDPDDAVFVTGNTNEGGNSSVWVRKYDDEGTEQWTDSFAVGSNFSDIGYGACADSAGNLIVTGVFDAFFGSGTPFIRKYDGSGNELWTQEPGAGATGSLWDCEVDSEDNIVAVGQLSQGSTDVLVIKYAP